MALCMNQQLVLQRSWILILRRLLEICVIFTISTRETGTYQKYIWDGFHMCVCTFWQFANDDTLELLFVQNADRWFICFLEMHHVSNHTLIMKR
jgi:hypothetical protein